LAVVSDVWSGIDAGNKLGSAFGDLDVFVGFGSVGSCELCDLTQKNETAFQ